MFKIINFTIKIMKRISILSLTLIMLISPFKGLAQTKGSNIKSTKNSSQIISLTLDSFKEKVWNFEKNPDKWVYEGNKPCIIDFYANWCAPCKKQTPLLEEIAKEYSNSLVIYKVDIDKEQTLAKIFNAYQIPALLFVPLNQTPQMSIGLMPKEKLVEAVNKVLFNKE